jgi:hypothetical protein
MVRTYALALTGLLAYAGLASAQYFPRSSEAPLPPQRLVNSRYDTEGQPRANLTESRSTGQIPSLAGNSGPVARESDFYPLAFIQRVYVNELGRQPSDQEASYWLLRMNYLSRQEVADQIRLRRPLTWPGHYDPRSARFPGDPDYPDPAGMTFRDPSGPYFKTPYLPNYQYRREMWAFPIGSEG